MHDHVFVLRTTVSKQGMIRQFTHGIQNGFDHHHGGGGGVMIIIIFFMTYSAATSQLCMMMVVTRMRFVSYCDGRVASSRQASEETGIHDVVTIVRTRSLA